MADQRVLAGRYELDSVLGHGGMAEVYLGTDRVLGRQIAVKILGSQFARDSSFVARFRREAQSAASLNHPNVVSVFDTGSDDGTHFIVMEYVQGKTLSQLIRERGRVPPNLAAQVAASVARALAFAHREGIVHRDVKPGNIMLTQSGDVKVMDFGIARATASESLTQTAMVLGTATYFSPEQAQGEGVDSRSDVYSLGVVLYEMLTGQPPFAGETAVSIAYKHVREDPVPPSRLNSDVPPDLDAIVLKCLAKNPANRYQSADELLADLERFLEGAPVSATPLLHMDSTEVVDRAARPTTVLPAPAVDEKRRRRWVIAGVIGILLLVLAVAMFFLARSLLGGGELVEVPNVIGETEQEAELILEREGFQVGMVDRVPSPEPEGIVTDYTPKEAELGAAIDLTVSTGPEMVPVPDVVCLTREDAVQRLRDEGLKSRRGANEDNPDCPEEGRVARTQPRAGTEVDAGSTVTLFLVGPVAPLEAPSAPDLAAGSDSGSSDTDNVTNQTSLTFNGTAAPDVSVTLFRDGAQVGTSTADSGGNWSITDPSAPPGTHGYEARASDEGENSEFSPGLDVTVDTAAPNTEITSGPEGEVSETEATFEFTSTEDGSSFECQLDAGGFEPCTSPTTYSDLADGLHTFEVKATDAAGNTDPTPAIRTWTVLAV